MKNKLSKISIGLSSLFTYLYVGASNVAAGNVSLCPPAGQPQPIGCGEAVDLGKIISSILNLLLFVAFVAALIFLIIGGIRWIMSGGDKEGTTKAKGTVTSALIGLAIVLGAWILINILLSFFGVTGGLTALTTPTLQIK